MWNRLGGVGRFGRKCVCCHVADVRERTPALLHPEAVPGEQLVGNREADVAHGQVVDEPAVRAIEERHCTEARRISQRERARKEVERQAGVDHVLDHEHVAAGNRLIEILEQSDAPVSAAAVGGKLDQVDSVRDTQGP